VREPIELSFCMVSGVGPGIGVLDEVHVTQGQWAISGIVSGIFRHLRPIRLNGWNELSSLRNVFDSCVKS